MRAIRIIVIGLLIVMIASCSTGNDSKLKGRWTTEEITSPISTLTFDGEICTVTDALFGNTQEYQYKSNKKEGVIYLYPLDVEIGKDNATSKSKYIASGYTLRFEGIVFKK